MVADLVGGNPFPKMTGDLANLKKKQPKLMLVNFKLLVLRMFVFHSLNLQLAKNWVGDRRDRDNAEGWIADLGQVSIRDVSGC